MKKDVIKWGIIGCGRIAEKVATDFSLVDGANLVAVASRDKERAEVFGSRYGVHTCYGDYETLINDPEIEAVYIATIHPMHKTLAVKCLQKGKAVLCEKPLGMNRKEVVQMVSASKENSSFLMEAIWTRFFPIIHAYVDMIERNTIGQIRLLKADFGFIPHADTHRLFKKDLGGGVLLDIGIYPLFLSLLSMGLPISVKATAHLTQSEIDTSCGMLLGYAKGSMAVLNATFEANTRTEAWIYGTEGAIQLHGRFHCPTKLTHWKNGEIEEEITMPMEGYGYVYELAHVTSCVRKGLVESPLLPHDLSIDLITLLDDVRQQIGVRYHQDEG